MSGFERVSYAFVAAGLATRAKATLYRISASRTNPEPCWQGDGEFSSVELTAPITDISFWNDRYVLTQLHLRKADGRTLTIDDAIVSVSLKKEIVRTALVGLNGTIKEYINQSDYDIRISVGIVATRDGQIVDEYPQEGISIVRDFLLENEALEVQSIFLDLFGIDQMVIADFSLSQQTASNRQVIEIKAISDREYVIESTEY